MQFSVIGVLEIEWLCDKMNDDRAKDDGQSRKGLQICATHHRLSKRCGHDDGNLADCYDAFVPPPLGAVCGVCMCACSGEEGRETDNTDIK